MESNFRAFFGTVGPSSLIIQSDFLQLTLALPEILDGPPVNFGLSVTSIEEPENPPVEPLDIGDSINIGIEELAIPSNTLWTIEVN